MTQDRNHEKQKPASPPPEKKENFTREAPKNQPQPKTEDPTRNTGPRETERSYKK